MADRYKTVLLFGAPGAGKGTQGQLLGNIPGFYHLSTGDMFRSLDRESEMGRIFARYSEKGELVPDELTIDLWRHYMDAQIASGAYTPQSDLLILDGIPRTTTQTELMDQYIDVLAVVHLAAANPEEMVMRLRNRALEQNRVDDAQEDVIRNRLEIYRCETRPVLGHYDRSLVHDIDAIGTLAMVLRDILGVVAPIQARCLSRV